MKIYKTQEEFDKDVVNGVFKVNDDVSFEFDLNTNAHIDARNINVGNIKAEYIDALDINALDIKAVNINSRNIKAEDINAWDINALDISYYAVCFAYKNIECTSIEGRRKNSRHFCLDGKIIIRE